MSERTLPAFISLCATQSEEDRGDQECVENKEGMSVTDQGSHGQGNFFFFQSQGILFRVEKIWVFNEKLREGRGIMFLVLIWYG